VIPGLFLATLLRYDMRVHKEGYKVRSRSGALSRPVQGWPPAVVPCDGRSRGCQPQGGVTVALYDGRSRGCHPQWRSVTARPWVVTVMAAVSIDALIYCLFI
jgi:hypothetical protein